MLTVEQIAAVCHEMSRHYCLLLGDDSIKPWKEAEEQQKQSCILGVKSVMTDPDKTAEQLHHEWKSHKISEGWKYGETKDSKLKTHPCIVDYEDLPIEQRIKDELFSSIVVSLM
ncbi:hypothetical protein Aeh1ORF227c [Aeromonas phage Aeh1]|uniref:Ryanodine receptor Ryr domain-containing protein n=1 Tax=Aeromonas phage Aeh1 TaxID=2880362 RepID=Q76YK7_9CAUD|nr:hypothetical protein Aeh1p238 [Aeromonas phage Aeh1]AAQ17888.1 hypothetical protein Aeh1ORF227c [Aeromonas phage Aeh1]